MPTRFRAALHAIESAWLDRLRTTQLFRYDVAASDFAPWPDASGQWVSDHVVEPVGVAAMGNLVDAHTQARIELRLVPNLWLLVELVKAGPWDVSCVRLINAVPPDMATE